MNEVPKKKHRYRHIAGKRLIEVRVKSPAQLFDARDPAPFRDRDLDDDFIEYITASVREISFTTPFKVVIYIEEKETKDLPSDSVREAIRTFLSYQIDLKRGDLKSFLKRAQMFFLIGLIILIACLSAAQGIVVPEPPGALGVLREGIVIFGWVSIWKPIELMLFDWYPLYEKLKFYQKLFDTEIEVQFATV